MDTEHHPDSGRGPARTTWAVDEQGSVSIGRQVVQGKANYDSRLGRQRPKVGQQKPATPAIKTFSFVLNMEIVTTFLEKIT